ncbi:MAG: hypothetical protein ACYTHK_09550 [Planctomycetota bacterium]
MANFAAFMLLGGALTSVVPIPAGFGWVLLPIVVLFGYLLHLAARERPHPLSVGYDRALLVTGVCVILMAATMHNPDRWDEEMRESVSLVHRFELVIAGACLLTWALRRTRSRFALPATHALSPLPLFIIPIGTVVSIWWMFSVRGRESADPSD